MEFKTYSDVIRPLRRAYQAANALGVGDQAFSKSLNDLFLANHLGHRLGADGQGADALHPVSGRGFEYKCSSGDDYIFHFGANKGDAANVRLLHEKFDDIEAAFFANIVWGKIERIIRVEMQALLPILIDHTTKRLQGRQFKYGLKWKVVERLTTAQTISAPPVGTYRAICEPLGEALAAAEQDGRLEPQVFSKGAHNHLFLAELLGHQIYSHGRGADAFDDEGDYEYKISTSDNFNFHFGARKTSEENERLIREKLGGLRGSYCALRRGPEITDIFFLPTTALMPYLIEQVTTTTGGQLLKNFKMAELDRRGFRIRLPANRAM